MPLVAVDVHNQDSREKIAIADLVLNFLLFTPLLVLHYQCTTVILDTLFLSLFPWIGAVILFAVGVTGQFLLTYYQRRVPGLLPGFVRQDAMCLLVATRLYTLLWVTLNICHITAVCFVFDQVSGGVWVSTVKACTTATLVLWGLKAGRNTVCAPLYLTLDCDSDANDFHRVSTVFRSQPDESKDSLLDCAVTTVVVYTFIHLHWASVTAVQDVLFLPSVPALSMLLSLAFGFTGCAVLIYLQHPASELSREFERENDVKRIAFEDLFQLAASVSIISYWRGVTMCFDIFMHYFPLYWRGFDVTALVGWIMSYLMLILVHLTNSLPFKGCELDGEITDGQGCLFSTHYFLDLLAEDKISETTEKSCETKEPGKADDLNNLRQRLVDGTKLHTTGVTPGVCVNNNLPNGNKDASHLKQA